MENIFDTRETEDTLRKTTCAEHSEIAQFVENILDLEETDDTPEKITCYPNSVHFVAFFVNKCICRKSGMVPNPKKINKTRILDNDFRFLAII